MKGIVDVNDRAGTSCAPKKRGSWRASARLSRFCGAELVLPSVPESPRFAFLSYLYLAFFTMLTMEVAHRGGVSGALLSRWVRAPTAAALPLR